MQIFHYTNSNRKPSGFTLIEILVVVGLALMVLTLVYGTLFYSGKSAAQARAEIVKKNEIFKQFHRIRFQLINMYQTEDGASFLGEKGIKERRSEIYFVTTSLKYNKGIGEVGYKMISDPDTGTYLAYTEFPYPRQDRFAPNNPLDKWHVASDLVRGLTVEYRQGADWVDEWKKKSPPEEIRLILWYEGEKIERERTLAPYTFMVRPGITSKF